MAKRKARAAKPAMCWGLLTSQGSLRPLASHVIPNSPDPMNDKAVRVRIIREADYRRLLKQARTK